MPWKETDPMLERTPFLAAYLRHVSSMTERCARFGSRRQTGDTGVRRDPEPGLAGLQEQRRAPHPHRRRHPAPAHHQAAPPARFDRCGREDNDARPHEALPSSAPAAPSRPAPRALPAALPAPTSPGPDVGRRVSHAGPFRFHTRQRFMRETRLQEDIAVEETADGLWSIDCDDVLLARLDARDFTRYV